MAISDFPVNDWWPQLMYSEIHQCSPWGHVSQGIKHRGMPTPGRRRTSTMGDFDSWDPHQLCQIFLDVHCSFRLFHLTFLPSFCPWPGSDLPCILNALLVLTPLSFSFHRCHSPQTACPRACLSICSLENPGSGCSASRSSPSQASVYSSLNWANHFTYKGPSSQSYGFPSSHVRMWQLDHKEDWVLKNWCFQTVVLEKILETLGQQGDQTSQS